MFFLKRNTQPIKLALFGKQYRKCARSTEHCYSPYISLALHVHHFSLLVYFIVNVDLHPRLSQCTILYQTAFILHLGGSNLGGSGNRSLKPRTSDRCNLQSDLFLSDLFLLARDSPKGCTASTNSTATQGQTPHTHESMEGNIYNVITDAYKHLHFTAQWSQKWFLISSQFPVVAHNIWLNCLMIWSWAKCSVITAGNWEGWRKSILTPGDTGNLKWNLSDKELILPSSMLPQLEVRNRKYHLLKGVQGKPFPFSSLPEQTFQSELPHPRH